jgi:hypothetical protein
VYVIWLDEARARKQLAATRAVHDMIAVQAGAKEHQLPDWEDPADVFADQQQEGEGAVRARDPAERAAQIQAFIAATGGERG